MSIIEVDHITKEYRLGAMQGLKQTLLNTAAKFTGKAIEEPPLFKALDDVSLSIEEGEVVGIIGHNGAGKSTLLKMLAGISRPSYGNVSVKGRIAPLIEVGAGFIPDFTGRENVYLNGSILGMTKQEIDRKFDEIVDFAEMAEFIDTPVKRYSSGMQVKLAFSVATSIEAEILIIDEVLAVGDLAFQRKCFDRMEDLIKRQNKTVLLVSHNLRQVARMSSRVIMLDHGKVTHNGNPDDVCNEFYVQSNKRIKEHHTSQLKKPKGNELFKLESIHLIDQDGSKTDHIQSNSPLTISATFNLKTRIEKPEIVIGTHTTDFIYLTGSSTDMSGGLQELEAGTHTIECSWSHFPLKTGTYAIRLAVFDQFRGEIFMEENLFVFSVTSPIEAKAPPLRLLDIPNTWSIKPNNEQ